MTSQAEPRQYTKYQKMLIALGNELKRRSKVDLKTGKEYLDPPLTEQECDWMEQAYLRIYQASIPHPANLPLPTNLITLLHRLAPDEVPIEFQVRAAEDKDQRETVT